MREAAEKLEKWIYNKVKKSGCTGCVTGVSGGVDSAVVLALCKKAFPDNTTGIFMPCKSIENDREDALITAERFGVTLKEISLDKIYDLFKMTLCEECPQDETSLSSALSNIKPRLRMITLYYHAKIKNSLVVGTGNKSELEVGYFTKHGDGGVDLLPLGNLVKSQVYELARYLGVPERVISKPPSAGLWEGQTDEKEMGFTYCDLENVLSGREVSPELSYKINRLRNQNSHKTKTPAIPNLKF